jgi:ubiquinone/menaquinone biosynthesis C-methylase UbiE
MGLEVVMSDRFGRAGADGYDQGFGSVSGQFVPTLLRLARVGPGHRVLDIATGSGVAAAAAVEAIGPSGQVIAADVSPAMLDKARQRIGERANVAFAVEDGQALTFPDCAFDAVLCAMGLMFFPDPARGLAEFRRVLREGGWAAVSVNTTPERAFVTRVDAIIGRHVPERSTAAAQCFSLGDAQLLQSLFATAGFQDIATNTETRRFPFASFSAYFAPIENGQGPTGQIFATLPAPLQQVVRDDVRRQLQGEAASDGPVEVTVEILTVCGRR